MRPNRAAWLPAGDDHLLLTAALHHDERGLAAWRAFRPRFVLDDADEEQGRVLPLVVRMLDATGSSDPDLGRMAGMRRHARIRSMRVKWSATEAVGALGAAGVDVMVLKGTALSATVYDNTGLRPMADADLLVRPTDVPEADRVLRDLGYGGRGLDDRRHVFVRHGLEYARSDGAEIDLHWMPHRALAPRGISRSFPRLPWEAAVDGDEWWQRTRTIDLMGVPVLAPSPTDVLLHVCLHGAFGGPSSRLRWVTDADALLRVEGSEIDWDGLISQAERRRVSHTLAAALGYLSEEHQLAVPADVGARLVAVPRGPRVRIAERWSTRPLPRHAPVIGDLPNTIVRFALLTRQDPASEVAQALPRFVAAGWGVDAGPTTLARTALAKATAAVRPTPRREHPPLPQ